MQGIISSAAKPVGLSALPRVSSLRTSRARVVTRCTGSGNIGSQSSGPGRFESSTASVPKDVGRKARPVIRREKVIGSRRPSQYFWAGATTFGAIIFFYNVFVLSDLYQDFQKITMTLYAGLSLLTSLYLWSQVYWSVGDGFNEYNRATKMVRLFRWGNPGKNRRFDLKVPFEDVAFVELGKSGDGIFLRVKGKMTVQLTSKGYLMTEEEIEYRGAELAKFLKCTIKKRA